MRNARRFAPALALAALVLAGCGSTRFVVVDSSAGAAPAGAAGGAAPATTASATAATDAERAEIEGAVETALTTDNDHAFEDRLPALEAGDDLEPTFAAVRNIVEGLDVELVIEAVDVTGDEATATMSVVVDGADFATGLPVTLVRREGNWKVTRAGACTLLALASPCPDAPTAG